MEKIIENMRKETREGFLKYVLNGVLNQAEQEWTNLLKKYMGHSNYLDEYKRILDAAKRGESIQDYSKKDEKNFSKCVELLQNMSKIYCKILKQ